MNALVADAESYLHTKEGSNQTTAGAAILNSSLMDTALNSSFYEVYTHKIPFYDRGKINFVCCTG